MITEKATKPELYIQLKGRQEKVIKNPQMKKTNIKFNSMLRHIFYITLNSMKPKI